MFKFIYKKRFLFILLFILFLLIFSSNVSANIFNGNPEIVDKLNSAFEKIESWMLKLATPAAAVAVAVGLFMKKFSFCVFLFFFIPSLLFNKFSPLSIR